MPKEKKFIYVKFKFDEKFGLPEGFIVSEDEERVVAWPQRREVGAGNLEQPETPQQSLFYGFFVDILNWYEKFRNSTLFIMSSLTVFRYIEYDVNIRNFVEEHGTKVEGKDSTHFRLDFRFAEQLNKKLVESRRLSESIEFFPAFIFIGLISSFDALIANLLRVVFSEQSNVLNGLNCSMPFSELFNFDSVEEIRLQFSEKHIQSILRESHDVQIREIEKLTNCSVNRDMLVFKNFIEICERRNLFTHADGVVSEQYLSTCKRHNILLENVALGEKLTIDSKYYIFSVETLFEFITMLTQLIWRKLKPNEIDKATDALNHFCYQMISQEHYELAISLLQFGLYNSPKHKEMKDATRLQMIINLANAKKLSGNKDEAISILDKEDLTSAKGKFLICVAAVRDDVRTVVKMMKDVVASKELSATDFREWPVFKKVRDDRNFIRTFEEVFGEPIILTHDRFDQGGASADLADRPDQHLPVRVRRSPRKRKPR